MRKKSVLILVALCLVASMLALVACNDNDNTPPEEGAWFAKTEIMSGTATATLTFVSDTEWKLDCDGAFLSKDWNPWQSGTYSFEGKAGESTLHMTATKESENTFIKGKSVGKEATYQPENGVYTIVFTINGDDATFQLKPPTNGTKPSGDSEKEEPCTEHVDENKDGKCDKCGADVEVPAQVQLTMLSEANASGQAAKIEMMTDGTWKLGISYYSGGEFTETASGTWAANGYESMTLTVTKDEASVLDVTTYIVPFDFATNPGNITYALTIKCNVPQVGELTFALSAKVAVPQQ